MEKEQKVADDQHDMHTHQWTWKSEYESATCKSDPFESSNICGLSASLDGRLEPSCSRSTEAEQGGEEEDQGPSPSGLQLGDEVVEISSRSDDLDHQPAASQDTERQLATPGIDDIGEEEDDEVDAGYDGEGEEYGEQGYDVEREEDGGNEAEDPGDRGDAAAGLSKLWVPGMNRRIKDEVATAEEGVLESGEAAVSPKARLHSTAAKILERSTVGEPALEVAKAVAKALGLIFTNVPNLVTDAEILLQGEAEAAREDEEGVRVSSGSAGSAGVYLMPVAKHSADRHSRSKCPPPAVPSPKKRKSRSESEHEAELKVLMRLPDGESMVGFFTRNATVGVLMQAVKTEIGVRKRNFRVLYAGREVQDEYKRRLVDIGVASGSEIRILLRLRGGGTGRAGKIGKASESSSRPPSTRVFYTRGGECVHSDQTCRALEGCVILSSLEVPDGRRWCRWCSRQLLHQAEAAAAQSVATQHAAAKGSGRERTPLAAHGACADGRDQDVAACGAAACSASMYSSQCNGAAPWPRGGRPPAVEPESEPEVWQILVRTLGGRTITTEVAPMDLVLAIKVQIEKKEGVPTQRQKLIFGGRQLKDFHMVVDAGLTRESLVHLVGSMDGAGT